MKIPRLYKIIVGSPRFALLMEIGFFHSLFVLGGFVAFVFFLNFLSLVC